MYYVLLQTTNKLTAYLANTTIRDQGRSRMGHQTGPVRATRRIPPVFVRRIRSEPVRDIRTVIPGGPRTYPSGGI